jgi:hypothetical protein
MVEVHANAVLLRRNFQHAQSFRHHFLADAVAGDDRDPILLFLLAHREFPSSPSFRKPCRADNAIYLIGLQWTKARHGATLHCNVDRFGGQPDS